MHNCKTNQEFLTFCFNLYKKNGYTTPYLVDVMETWDKHHFPFLCETFQEAKRIFNNYKYEKGLCSQNIYKVSTIDKAFEVITFS